MIETVSTFLLCIIMFWIILVLIMFPVYFIRKRRNPSDKNNTIKSLLIKSLIVSILFWIVFCSGLIKMYIDDLN